MLTGPTGRGHLLDLRRGPAADETRYTGEQVEVAEGDKQRRRAHLAEGELGPAIGCAALELVGISVMP